MEIEPVCGNCNFCEKNDGTPYCYLKDLFTNVELTQKCDVYNVFGMIMFAPEKIGGLK